MTKQVMGASRRTGVGFLASGLGYGTTTKNGILDSRVSSKPGQGIDHKGGLVFLRSPTHSKVEILIRRSCNRWMVFQNDKKNDWFLRTFLFLPAFVLVLYFISLSFQIGLLINTRLLLVDTLCRR